MNPALLSSKRNDWRTPPELLGLVASMEGGITLDPCAGEFIGGEFHLTEDGLSRSWASPGVTFCNPPYSRRLPLWTAKVVAEAALGQEIVLLVPARTDTRWWHRDIAARADAICFLKGRLHFDGAKCGAPFPSAVCYYGERTKAFVRAFAGKGWTISQNLLPFGSPGEGAG